ERREGFDVSLLLRSVHAPRSEGDLDVVPGGLRGFLNRRAAAENDQVSKRDLLAGLRSVEFPLDRLQFLKGLRQLRRLVDVPVLLRREANARTVCAATLVRAAEAGGRRPGRRDQLADG